MGTSAGRLLYAIYNKPNAKVDFDNCSKTYMGQIEKTRIKKAAQWTTSIWKKSLPSWQQKQ